MSDSPSSKSFSRRSFIFRSLSLSATAAAANTGVYVLGSAFKNLDGQLTAGAKTYFNACFIAGTPVTMSDFTTKPIELIEIGEEVLTYDEITRKQTKSLVEKIYHHEEAMSTLYTFTLAGKTVTSNHEHLFYLPVTNTYLSAEKIYELWSSGEEVRLLSHHSSELVRIDHIAVSSKSVMLYNIHVTSPYDQTMTVPRGSSVPGHNYYANGYLVHNVKQCGCGSGCSTCCNAAYSCEVTSGINCWDDTNKVYCSFDTPADESAFLSCYGAIDISCNGPN